MRDELLFYCRTGFEPECCEEAQMQAQRLGHIVQCEVLAGGGAAWVRGSQTAIQQLESLPISSWVFARQRLRVLDRLDGLNIQDRVGPVAAAVPARHWSALWLEAADSPDGRPLMRLCRGLEPHVRHALIKRGLRLEQRDAPRLHVFFPTTASAWLASSDPRNASPWLQGIPRLRVAQEAPSRSALKLEEAIETLLQPEERQRLLRPGKSVVDLGAAPGGWSWVLASRGLKVTAVDHGRLAPQLLANYPIRHCSADGFVWRPAKSVDWLVCDIVDKPARVSDLMGRWLREGLTRNALFNLKLPMRKRFQEIERCRQHLAKALAGRPHQIRMRQLYHDREEITVLAMLG